MDSLKKIILTPFFGDLPEWMDKFESPKGYGWLLDTDLEDFKKRVKRVLDIDYTGEYGSGKPWDYRCALGLLYEEEIKGFGYWGTMDFDMVFGDVDKWFTDKELIKYHVWSNHHSYVNGCWTLYKNCKEVNTLFMNHPDWQDILSVSNPTAWVERSYSRLLEQSGLQYKYSFEQGWPYTVTPNLMLEDGKLYQDGEEIAMFHFRRSKKYPL